MDTRAIQNIQRQLADLGRAQVVHRTGIITSTNPLSVALGGSDIPYTNVKAIAGVPLTEGDVVSVLSFGADQIILGRITNGPGTLLNIQDDTALTVASNSADYVLPDIDGDQVNGLDILGRFAITTTQDVSISLRLNNANVTADMVQHTGYRSAGTQADGAAGFDNTTSPGLVLAQSNFSQSCDVIFSARVWTRTGANRHAISDYASQSGTTPANHLRATMSSDWRDTSTPIAALALRLTAASGFTAATLRSLVLATF